MTLTLGIRVVKPLAGRALDLYALVQPEGDKRLLGRPEFKAMFVDDLLNGSRKQRSPLRCRTCCCSPATGASGSAT
jgi:hypothetical protein